MTYFGFLSAFLGIPLLLLGGIYLWDYLQGRRLPPGLQGLSFWFTTLAHVVVALLYTTPWDNYLVATGVWYYDPSRVTGIKLGYVPIEEYTFFVVQTIVACLWMHFIALRIPPPEKPFRVRSRIRWMPIALLGIIWLVAIGWLSLGYQPGTYMGLILGWAIPPILLQFFFGGDIIRYHLRMVVWVLLPLTVYLSLADSIAIYQGVWVISPHQSFGFYLGGVLPVEEFVFFLATNTLICLGVTLFLARQSHERMRQKFPRWPVRARLIEEELEHG